MFRSILLTTLFALFASKEANAHQNTTLLSNGAELSVSITSPYGGDRLVYDPKQGIRVQGTASVGMGNPDVAYIYILDVSPSTRDDDGDCGTVLECVQKFFISFNEQAIEDGSAEIAGVITFHQFAKNVSGFLPPDDKGVDEAILAANNVGTSGTYCSEALKMAADFVEDPSNTAGTTIVVLAGDGVCVNEGGDDPVELEAAALRLEETGAIVHTVAVGDSVNCTESLSSWSSGNVANDMDLMPRNGGRCTSVKDPDELTHIIDDLLRTTILSVEMKVDEGVYLDVDDLTESLPLEGAEDLEFGANAGILGVGAHELCVRVTGNSTLGSLEHVVDCHEIIVSPQPTESPTLPTPTLPDRETPAPQKTIFSESSSGSKAGMIVGVLMVVLVGVAVMTYFARKALVRTPEPEQTAHQLPAHKQEIV